LEKQEKEMHSKCPPKGESILEKCETQLPKTSLFSKMANQISEKKAIFREAGISPQGCEQNLIKDPLFPNTSKTLSSQYTPIRNPTKSAMYGGAETKRLSRQNFDTKQYRSDNKGSALDKRKSNGTSTTEDEEEDKNSTSEHNCGNSYNNEICRIMNCLYNSPNSSKVNIVRIHHEVISDQ
jgi:alpha-galactosidase/6-phospho-beta-glucosidase family protein